MKKLLAIIILGLLFCNLTIADTSMRINNKYSGDIEVNDVVFSLPEGEWLLVDKAQEFVKGLEFKHATFVQEENNILKGTIEFVSWSVGGHFTYWIDLFAVKTFFKYPTDGCFEKPEYFIVESWTSGPSLNCFVVRHVDTWKEIHDPENNSTRGIYLEMDNSYVRKWIRDNNIELPKIMLSDYHWFYAKSAGQKMVSLMHSMNPELSGAKKTKFQGENESEYHKFNIDKYPETKKFMENFINQSVKRHAKFEESVKAKAKHKLDLSEWNISKNGQNKKKEKKNSNLTKEIKELKKLYDEGVLTQEEFKKAKKKLLN